MVQKLDQSQGSLPQSHAVPEDISSLAPVNLHSIHPLRSPSPECSRLRQISPNLAEAKLASDQTRQIDSMTRVNLARADLAIPGNVWLLADQHRGKGLYSDSDGKANALEVEANFRASTNILTQYRDVTSGIILLGDLSDSRIPYQQRREIILASVRTYSAALECATSGRWIALLLGNHEVERATELKFQVEGQPRSAPLFAGRLLPREDLQILSRLNPETRAKDRMIDPAKIPAEIGAKIRELNIGFGRRPESPILLSALAAVIPDFEKLNELTRALEQIPGVQVLQKTHRVGTLLELAPNFRVIIAHDPIVNGENIGRILTRAEKGRPTVRLGHRVIQSLIIGDQHTNGLVESADFDTVSVGSLGGNLSREAGNPPAIVSINPSGSGRANFWNISSSEVLSPITFEDISYIRPQFHLDQTNVAQMFDSKNVVIPGRRGISKSE